MTGSNRQHSRGGSSSGHAARTGAGQIKPDAASPADQPAGVQPPSADQPPEGDDTQAFAGRGQFTGRPVPPQAAPKGAPAGATPSGPPPSDHMAAPGGVVDAEHYEAVVRERDEFKGDLQRLVAEFDNFRKRAIREREQVAAAADAKLLGEMLAVLDDLERALGHGGGQAADATQVLEGVGMVHSRLLGVLTQHGLTAFEPQGAFDPHLHEAVMMRTEAGVEEGLILEVLQKGYMLGERVLRHAKVVVAG